MRDTLDPSVPIIRKLAGVVLRVDACSFRLSLDGFSRKLSHEAKNEKARALSRSLQGVG